MKWIVDHRKAITAAVGGVLEIAVQLGFTGRIQQILTVVLAALTGLGVYQLRNGTKPAVNG